MQLKNDYGGDEFDRESSGTKAEVGIPVQPLDYLAKACKLVHPDMMHVKLSAHMEETVLKQKAASGLALRRERIAWTNDVLDIARSCADKELELSSVRPEHLRQVLQGKRFATMHAALERVDYPDACVALEANNGFPLVGWMKGTGVFASCLRPPELHVEGLVSMAASYNARTIASIKPSDDVDMDMEVWRATLSEV